MTAAIDLRETTDVPSRHVASVVSEAFGPMPVGVASCVGVGAAERGWSGAGWGLLAIVFAAVIPYIITWPMRHPGNGSKPSRRTRLHYLLITICSAILGLLLVALLGAPRQVIAIAVMIVVGLLVGAVVNARWRMSNHVAAVSGATAALSVLYGAVWLLGFLIVVAVAWARVRLGKHTPAEVIVGAFVGGAVGAFVLALLG